MLKVIIKGTKREIATIPDHQELRFLRWHNKQLHPGTRIYFIRKDGEDVPMIDSLLMLRGSYLPKQLKVVKV